jgi:hypothetical protein
MISAEKAQLASRNPPTEARGPIIAGRNRGVPSDTFGF